MAYQRKVQPRSYASGYIEYRISQCPDEKSRRAMAEHLLVILNDQLAHKQKRKKDTDDTMYGILYLSKILDQPRCRPQKRKADPTSFDSVGREPSASSTDTSVE